MKKICYLALMIILLVSCSGNDENDKDKVPPANPQMITHLGDVGDNPVMIDDVMVTLTDENNGIDAVPEGNWIRVSWKPFVDNDLSHMKIFRFSDIDTTNVEIDDIQANGNSYLDQGPLVERVWYSYYAQLFDASGNFAYSDTVSYAILAKSNLLSPPNGAVVSAAGLRFEWNKADDRTGFYRVLVWDEERNLLWHGDLNLATEDNPLWLSFPNFNPPIPSGTTLRWRVDYFDWDEDHQIYRGSESEERIIHLQ